MECGTKLTLFYLLNFQGKDKIRSSNNTISIFDVVSDDIGPKSRFLSTIIKNILALMIFFVDE